MYKIFSKAGITKDKKSDELFFFGVTDLPTQSALELKIVSNDIKYYMKIHNRVRRMFDLDTDFFQINEKFANDKILSKGMNKGRVPRLPVAFNPFELVIRAILGQQITIKAAKTLAGRIAEKAEIRCSENYPEGLDYFSPDPAELAELELDGLGITGIRQDSIKTVTLAVVDGRLGLEANQKFDSFHEKFSSLKGIGDWTVHYVAMRGLGMTDSFPASDLGVIRAIAGKDSKISPKQMIDLSQDWRPYRSYATLCLWNIEKNGETA